MTDDQTRPIETPMPVPMAGEPGLTEPAAAEPTYVASTAPATTTAPVPTPRSSPSRVRWAIALAIAALAVSGAVAAVLLFGAQSMPEALKYIPGDAAFVAELRMDLPGDQMQALGNLLAHFPGFEDQASLQEKIDTALSKAIAQMPDSKVDYATEVKPLIGGPMFIGIRSFKDMATSTEPKNFVVVATTNGAMSCDTALKGQTLTHTPLNGLDLVTASDGKAACVVDGRFLLVGDEAGVKQALDAHAQGTGLDKSARYIAARTGLGKDRLATLYVDGVGLKDALPAASADPSLPISGLGDLGAAIPEWIIAGVRAESDALLFDLVLAPPAGGATPDPSFRPFPAVHPTVLAPLAPADSLVFYEAQGVATSIHNLVTPLKADPQFAAALAQLDQFGGLDGLIDWVDDVGVVVVRDGDTPAGGLMLVAHDATSATEKITTLKTVVTLGAAQLGADVSESTVAGIKVTTMHIDDIGALLGGVTGTPQVLGQPVVALDISFAARDRVVYIGIGTGTMAKLLGVAAGASLADDPAFKRALVHGIANPQAVFYVAAGASLDWLETIVPAEELAKYTSDVKPYVDPLESILLTSVGDGRQGSSRLAFIVPTP